MGDRRYDLAYQKLNGPDRLRALATLSDEEVISALAAASRARDAYLANILATAAHNRLRRARAVMESLGEGLCILDRHGLVTHSNLAASGLLGIPCDELERLDFHRLVHPTHGPEQHGGSTCPLAAALDAEGTTRLELGLVGRTGTFPALLTVSPIRSEDAVEGHVVLFQDVTRAKRAEELLLRQTKMLEDAVERSADEVRRRAEAEALFRQIFEANPDPVIVTDDDDRIVLMNARAQAAFGYGPGIFGERAGLLFAGPPGAAESSGWVHKDPQGTVHARRQDGSTFVAELAAAIALTPASTLRITTVRDVTARQMEEDRLRRRGELLAQAEEIARLGSWELDLATERLTWSSHLYRIFGYSPGSLPVDMDLVLSHVHPDHREGFRRIIETARRTGKGFDCEHRIRRIDGGFRTVHARGSCIRDHEAKVVRMVGTVQDVTEQRETEDALRRAEGKLQQVLETVAEGVIIFDVQGKMLYANPAAKVHPEMRSANGSEWMKAWQPRIFHRGGTPVGDLRALLERVIGGEPLKDVELDVEQPDGRRISILLNAVPLQEGGRPVAVLTSFHDVSALRDARDRLQELSARLEERVAVQTETLRTANHELEAFAYSVSHDLQAPLRAIDFFADDLLARKSALAPEDAAALERIVLEVRRMRRLVHDLLELSKLHVGEVRREPVDMSAIARDILATLAEREPERDVETHVEDGLVAFADGALTRVLLENLLGNAWKYTSRTGRSARIEVGRDGERAFFVRDNGAGFDPKRAGGLFKPFVRLHEGTRYEGTGIGLATVRRVTEKHGGRVWAASTPGEGATFWFTLGEDAAGKGGGADSPMPARADDRAAL